MSAMKTLLITGASRGVGKACAISLAKKGYQLILLSANTTALKKVGDELLSIGAKEPILCPFDLEKASADDYIQLTNELEHNYARLDGLVHFAARLYSLSPIEHISMQQWHSIMQINLNARFNLTKGCLPLLKKAPTARIVFPLSTFAYNKGCAYWGAYQVSEVANRTLASILTEELVHTNIQVNVVKLPAMDTYLRHKAYPFEDKSTISPPCSLENFWQQFFDDALNKKNHSFSIKKTTAKFTALVD